MSLSIGANMNTGMTASTYARTLVSVVRYNMLRPFISVIMPWVATAFSFAVNEIVRVVNHVHGGQTGGVGSIYAVLFVEGILFTTRWLPFGLALGMSRRTFYIGTVLLAVCFGAIYGVALTLLQVIERASGGWGIGLHFFRIPYFLDGPWYLTLLTSFVVLILMFGYGVWFGIVYRRWDVSGLMTFIIAQVTVMLFGSLIVTWTHAWTSVGHFFTTLTAAGLTGVLAALAAALLVGGYLTIRRTAI